MEIEDLLSIDAILYDVKVSGKKQILQELASKASGLTGIEERLIFETLLERERLGTTGIGQGIAIPHGKMPDLTRPYGVFARLGEPIDFDAVDNEPVDLVFLLLAPEAASAEHLKALARVSRLLRDQTLCSKLRGSDSAEALYVLLTETEASHAA